ncbi:hypothetical protein [Paenisporosarcina sp. NPDC076898]
MKFKSMYKNETVYINDEAIQFFDYEYTTDDKKLQAALLKVKGIKKASDK